MKLYVRASRRGLGFDPSMRRALPKVNMNKRYTAFECVPDSWKENFKGMSESEIIESLEDSGFSVPDPITLNEACELYYRECGNDYDEVMNSIELDYGNEVGVLPLNIFEYYEQMAIFDKWYQNL